MRDIFWQSFISSFVILTPARLDHIGKDGIIVFLNFLLKDAKFLVKLCLVSYKLGREGESLCFVFYFPFHET